MAAHALGMQQAVVGLTYHAAAGVNRGDPHAKAVQNPRHVHAPATGVRDHRAATHLVRGGDPVDMREQIQRRIGRKGHDRRHACASARNASRVAASPRHMIRLFFCAA